MGHKGVKVAVGLSGGVDSSVAALLLKEKGYDVVGITMEIYDDSLKIEEGKKHACYGPGEKEDVARAASMCRKLGIPFFRIDLKEEYGRRVIEYFKSEYSRGRTPNPCIVCNHKLKFGFLLDKAKKSGIDFSIFATGHYARIVKSGDRFMLKRAVDHSKDQSYFLYGLKSDQLRYTLFPVGELTKRKVREIARAMGLETADLPESQDFIGGGDYSALFSEGEMTNGNIVDEQGSVLGKHRGIIHYTIGQRRGLGISSASPLYVKRISAEKNRVVVSQREGLFSEGLIASGFNVMVPEGLNSPRKLKAKIRSNHKAVDVKEFTKEEDRAKIVFAKLELSVSPGQSVVLYLDDTVFGGGIIESAF